jgi:hypothetical protein
MLNVSLQSVIVLNVVALLRQENAESGANVLKHFCDHFNILYNKLTCLITLTNVSNLA